MMGAPKYDMLVERFYRRVEEAAGQSVSPEIVLETVDCCWSGLGVFNFHRFPPATETALTVHTNKLIVNPTCQVLVCHWKSNPKQSEVR